MLGVRVEAYGQDVAAPVASAQDPTADVASEPTATNATVDASTACCTLPDGTIVELEIAEPLSSKTAQRGQRFKLRLASPLYAGEHMLLPAGTEGIGEVVHADRARAAGKPGELLLAGRSLSGPNGELKLRGFRLGGSGENRTVAAFWIPLGFFIRGGQIELPVGARAHAKLAGPHVLTPLPATPSVPPATTTDMPPAAPTTDPTQASTPAENGTDTSPPHQP